MKEVIWKNATASNVNTWAMLEIKELNKEAFKHLVKIPPRFCRKYRFRTTPRCDTLMNNMLEAFNSVFITARAKPIVTIIEEIRVYLMLRWESNWQKIFKYEGHILPNIKRKISKESQRNKQLDSEVILCVLYMDMKVNFSCVLHLVCEVICCEFFLHSCR